MLFYWVFLWTKHLLGKFLWQFLVYCTILYCILDDVILDLLWFFLFCVRAWLVFYCGVNYVVESCIFVFVLVVFRSHVLFFFGRY